MEKHWEYKGETPAWGKIFHHKTRRTILIIYQDKVKLFDKITDGEEMCPYYSQRNIERKCGLA